MTDPTEAACRVFWPGWDRKREATRYANKRRVILAIAAYERALWVEAPHAPAEWEGKRVLLRWPDGTVEDRFLRNGYARDELACGGLLVRLFPEFPP